MPLVRDLKTGLTPQEKGRFRVGTCPACDSRVQVTWTRYDDPNGNAEWVPSSYKCTSRQCENSEPSLAGIQGLTYTL